MPLLKSIISGWARTLERTAHDPEAAREAQRGALARVIAECGGSEVARRFGLHRARGPDELRRLPATDYAMLSEELARARALGVDGAGIFGRSRLMAFGQTSGTTAEPKRLPLSRAYLASYRRASALIYASFFYTSGEWAQLRAGKRLLLPARPETGRSPDAWRPVPDGFVSGIMAAGAPWWMKSRFLPSEELLRLPSWEEKMGLILDEARGQDVRMIAGVPALIIAFAEKAIERHGVRSLNELWPELGMAVYGGIALSAVGKARIRALFGTPAGKPFYFWELYAATEGQFGHSFDPSWPGMVFNPFETFYQFVDVGNGLLHQLHELEAGRKYAMLVTTPGGLVNYRMGDLVEILSTRPLTFRVSGREKEELSLEGEKIAPDQLERALELAGLRVADFAVWPEPGRPHRLVWGLGGLDAERETEAAGALDRALREVNGNYAEMRINDWLYGAPAVRALPAQVFSRYRERNLDRGQFKGKRIFKDSAELRTELEV